MHKSANALPGHRQVLVIRGRRYKEAWLRQRISRSKSDCYYRSRVRVCTAINGCTARVGNAVTEAARRELHGYDDAPWPMWYILYATLLVLRRVGHCVYSLMRNGNATQHCQCLCDSVGTATVMRNGNSMQNAHGDFVNVCVCCYVSLMLCGGLNKSILQVWRMRNGNTLQQVYGTI